MIISPATRAYHVTRHSGATLHERPHGAPLARLLATVTPHPLETSFSQSSDLVPGTPRRPKKSGTIAEVFGGLQGREPVVLPERFAVLKQQICKNPELFEARWRSVLRELENEVQVIGQKGSEVVPQVAYSDIEKGLSVQQVQEIKKRGVVIVKGGVPKEVRRDLLPAFLLSTTSPSSIGSSRWKQSNIDYVAANKDRVTARARAHPALVTTQAALLGLWHTSSTAAVGLRTPISYFDRLRIRPHDPSVFTLGAHVDGGGVERWEDPGFRARILGTEGVCSVFRPWQGWTALSHTAAREGTLQVLPMLTLASAYIMLRPFFARCPGAPARSLAADDWAPDLASTAFPGSVPAKAQELNDESHPHLVLPKTLVSIPRVEPGDQVYWHCDVVHVVEAEHTGSGDSSVLYIPAVPLTLQNAAYLRDQRETFKRGQPSLDFPGGEGEAYFVGRVKAEDVKDKEAQRMFGLAPFDVPAGASESEKNLVDAANRVLFA
ncbi:hypothetical protein FOMPIDRAFT_1023830 [Fomitopsis schrenkii]|uniref:DUF1479-domain-containing protein n=1 Tax=Fomitopsis schrenkii TaxID=2126942 RepID=S8FGC3_FOMSC|nr:hypothetical protein FOMPIDRAFT_1023830 [Fomitopsis schrenkii]